MNSKQTGLTHPMGDCRHIATHPTPSSNDVNEIRTTRRDGEGKHRPASSVLISSLIALRRPVKESRNPHRNGTRKRDERTSRRTERNGGTDSPRRQARRGSGIRVGRDDAGKELSPTCLLTNLLTCLLANLPTCPLYLLCFLGWRLVSRLVPVRAVPRFACHSAPSSSYPRLAGRYERRGGFFSSARLIRRVRIPSCSAPFSQAHSFRRLAVPSRLSARRAYVTQSFSI